MTNKELAAQCLIEAAELLDESAGRNGVFDRNYATSELNRLKKDKTNLEKDALGDWYHGGREQRLKDLEKEARTGKGYRYGKPELKGKDYLNERSNRQSEGRTTDIIVDINNNNSKTPELHKLINRNAEIAEAKAKHKQALEDMPYRYEKLMRKSKNEKDRRLASESKNEKDGERKFNLRKRIIERFIKSKNESVDIDALLEEAMDLLDY